MVAFACHRTSLITAVASDTRVNRISKALLCVLIVTVAACAPRPAAGQERPNIVYILVDDLGWGDLSCYGQNNWDTPRLDRMAAEGMLFEQAYAGSTVCAPSRAALLTGNHTGTLFMRGNGDIQLRRDPEDITIATRLRDLGYATAMIGKSGVACHSTDVDLPHDKGFDRFYGLLSHRTAHRHYPSRILDNGAWVDIEGNRGKTGDIYASELFVDEAITWIEQQGEGKPFFLHLAITPPHADLVAPERFVAPFRGQWSEKPHTTSGYYHQPEPRAAFAGMVAFLDDAVGRVLDAVVDHGIERRTIVFFASDNGPHAEGGADPNAFDSNGPWRGWKRDLYEGGIRVPQIVWWPGMIEPGVRSDHITAFWDFPATALELAGGNSVPAMDGISIVPTLLGRSDLQRQHRALYWEFHEQGGKQAVRLGRFKGIRLNVGKQPDGPVRVFDLAADPGETTDVAAENPEVASEMVRIIDEMRTPSDEFRFGAAR